MKIKAFIPIAIFLGLFILLIINLDRDTRYVPSPLIDKPAPTQSLPELNNNTQFSPESMKEKRWVLNVWASWCVACRQEHNVLLDLAKNTPVNLIGYNYKDTADMASAWLTQLGDPYDKVIQDIDGQVALDWGIYGVPETYLIDEFGIIRYKHIGPLDKQAIDSIVIPFLNTGQVS